MSGVRGTARIAFSVALLLAALVLVAWRQSRAYEALSELDRIQREIDNALAERTELMRRAQLLESRAHVVRAARDELGMHLPDASEIVFLEGAGAAIEPPRRAADAPMIDLRRVPSGPDRPELGATALREGDR